MTSARVPPVELRALCPGRGAGRPTAPRAAPAGCGARNHSAPAAVAPAPDPGALGPSPQPLLRPCAGGRPEPLPASCLRQLAAARGAVTDLTRAPRRSVEPGPPGLSAAGVAGHRLSRRYGHPESRLLATGHFQPAPPARAGGHGSPSAMGSNRSDWAGPCTWTGRPARGLPAGVRAGGTRWSCHGPVPGVCFDRADRNQAWRFAA